MNNVHIYRYHLHLPNIQYKGNATTTQKKKTKHHQQRTNILVSILVKSTQSELDEPAKFLNNGHNIFDVRLQLFIHNRQHLANVFDSISPHSNEYSNLSVIPNVLMHNHTYTYTYTLVNIILFK